jgi:peptidoglycan hydrolase CwlO-like protein
LERTAQLVRAARPHPRSWLAATTMAGLSVAVVCLGAPTGRAAADTTPSPQAQLAALEAQVQAGAAQVASLTLAYEQAATQAASLQGEIASDRAEVAELQARLAATTATLRADAISSYVGGPANPTEAPAAAGEAQIGAEYLDVAAGDLSDVADQFRAQSAELHAAQAELSQQLQASEAAMAAAASARQADLAQAARVEERIAAVQQQIAALAAQQAAEQAAQQAAERAAQLAAARPVTPPTQGLPVNNGLVSVVQDITAPDPPGGGAGGVWLRLRECESGDNYQENTGNGYYGAYQFSQQTWTDLGYPGRPDLEPPAMQDAAAMQLQRQSGWGQWPACAAALGLT